jgi:sialate O-acetylesterase
LKYDFKYSNIPADFPELTGMTCSNDQAVLSFVNVKQFRVRNGKNISGFEVAGNDAVFKPASAVVNGAQIILKAPKVGKVRQVRYLWSDPNAGNLSAETGLPLGAFVYDDRSAEEIILSRRGGEHLIYLYDMHNSWDAKAIKYKVDNSGKFPGRKIKRI